MKIKHWISALALPLVIAACNDKKEDPASGPVNVSAESEVGEATEPGEPTMKLSAAGRQAAAKHKEPDKAAITGAIVGEPPHEVESPFTPEPAPPTPPDPEELPPAPEAPAPTPAPGITPP